MAWASPPKVALGCVAFAVFWIMAVVPVVQFLPIGRTAGSLLGATLMVVFGVLTPDQAFDAIDLPILALLFGTMVVSIYLQRADLFKYLGWVLSWKSSGGKDLLCRVSVLSAICSAVFTNDTTCFVLTEFVLEVCRDKKLPPQPFLIALASSANIGSSTTPIGNPQNLVIAVQSKVSFGRFLTGVVAAMILGLFVNTLLLLAYYWTRLNPASAAAQAGHQTQEEVDAEEENAAPETGECSLQLEEASKAEQDYQGSPRTQAGQRPSLIAIAQVLRMDSRELPAVVVQPVSKLQGMKAKLWKTSVYLVTVGMLVAFLCGLNLSWTAITTAVVLMVLDFTDAGPSLDQVSYSLLVFFTGMFIAVRGFNTTGAPGEFWEVVEEHARINNAKGVAILSAVIILLSNVASNVPTVLLLGSRVAASAAARPGTSVTKAWLILAWVSTVAGNLTPLGSAANIIVSEQARRAETEPYELSSWNHLRFGFPATFIVIAVGEVHLVK